MILNILKQRTLVLIFVFVVLCLITLMNLWRQDYLSYDINNLSKPLAWDQTGRYTIHYLQQSPEQIDWIYLLRDNQKNAMYYENVTNSGYIPMWMDVYDKNLNIKRKIKVHDNTYPYTLQMSLKNGAVKLRIYDLEAEDFIVKSVFILIKGCVWI